MSLAALAQLEDQTLIQFLDDTIEYLKGVRVPFLSKYAEYFGGTSRLITPSRDFIVSTIETGLRRAGSQNLDGFKQSIASTISEEDMEAITPKALDIICTCAYSRRSELKKIMTDLVFKQT
jgi:hypothetical protein